LSSFNSWLKPFDFIIPLLFWSELLLLSYTFGGIGGCYILTLIICYLFFGGKGGIKGFSTCLTWFDWYRLISFPDSFETKDGALRRSAPKIFFSSGLLINAGV
jgi:hypothetical protein